MTPDQLAALHRRCFADERNWSAGEFADLLANPATILVTGTHTMLLGWVIGEEAEILTLGTDPAHRRQGAARTCLAQFLDLAAERGAGKVLLEVSESNLAALNFYARSGFSEVSRRRGYYLLADGTRVDAILMSRPLPG